MTISTTNSYITHLGNDVTTVFTYDFRVDRVGDFNIVIQDATTYEVLSTLTEPEFVATGLGSDDGGTITYDPPGDPLATGKRITISRRVEATQPFDPDPYDSYNAVAMESVLDRVTMLVQQVIDTQGVKAVPAVAPFSMDEIPTGAVVGVGANRTLVDHKVTPDNLSADTMLLIATGTPIDMESIVAAVTDSLLAAPVRITGELELGNYSGVVVGPLADDTARMANYTAIAAGVAWANSNGKHVILPDDVLEYKGGATESEIKLGLKFPNGIRKVLGQGTMASGLRQFDASMPVATLGMIGNVATYASEYRDFGIGMGVQGTAGSRGLKIGKHFQGRFQNLNIGRGYGGFCPEIGWEHIAGCDFFSNYLETINVQAGQTKAMSVTVNGTGSVWNNIYIGGGTTPPSESSDTNLLVLTEQALYINGHFQGVWDQVNTEWIKAPTMIHVQNTPSMEMHSLHIEANKPTGNIFRIYSSTTNLYLSSVQLYNNNIKTAYTSTDFPIFSMGAGSRVELHGLEMRQNATSTNYGGVDRVVMLLKSEEVVGAYDQFRAYNVTIGSQNVTAGFRLDNNVTLAYGAISNFVEHKYIKGRSVVVQPSINITTDADASIYANMEDPIVSWTAPITADRKVICLNKRVGSGVGDASKPKSGNLVRVQRTAAATGAFNVNICDAASSTLVSLSNTSLPKEGVVEFNGTDYQA